jgi:hypothetical protein
LSNASTTAATRLTAKPRKVTASKTPTTSINRAESWSRFWIFNQEGTARSGWTNN